MNNKLEKIKYASNIISYVTFGLFIITALLDTIFPCYYERSIGYYYCLEPSITVLFASCPLIICQIICDINSRKKKNCYIGALVFSILTLCSTIGAFFVSDADESGFTWCKLLSILSIVIVIIPNFILYCIVIIKDSNKNKRKEIIRKYNDYCDKLQNYYCLLKNDAITEESFTLLKEKVLSNIVNSNYLADAPGELRYISNSKIKVKKSQKINHKIILSTICSVWGVVAFLIVLVNQLL